MIRQSHGVVLVLTLSSPLSSSVVWPSGSHDLLWYLGVERYERLSRRSRSLLRNRSVWPSQFLNCSNCGIKEVTSVGDPPITRGVTLHPSQYVIKITVKVILTITLGTPWNCEHSDGFANFGHMKPLMKVVPVAWEPFQGSLLSGDARTIRRLTMELVLWPASLSGCVCGNVP